MFSPSNMLLKYLNAKPREIYDIVGALEGYLNADPKFQTNDFMDAVQYVLSHGVSRSELFREFDPGMELEEDEDQWDYNYYALARVYLKDNFCEKRIRHVQAVAKKLYGAALSQSEITNETNVRTEPTQTSHTAQGGEKLEWHKGGQQSEGKKTQDQPNQELSATTPIPRGVKIGGLLLFGVVLVLLIVFIIKLG